MKDVSNVSRECIGLGKIVEELRAGGHPGKNQFNYVLSVYPVFFTSIVEIDSCTRLQTFIHQTLTFSLQYPIVHDLFLAKITEPAVTGSAKSIENFQ